MTVLGSRLVVRLPRMRYSWHGFSETSEAHRREPDGLRTMVAVAAGPAADSVMSAVLPVMAGRVSRQVSKLCVSFAGGFPARGWVSLPGWHCVHCFCPFACGYRHRSPRPSGRPPPPGRRALAAFLGGLSHTQSSSTPASWSSLAYLARFAPLAANRTRS